ncbi:Major facilitator superfamily domain general substrate transporter [Penicillium cf. griseofulvum]|uniref:Major facilitator superfamily domain general substrate transporter n=1 Tax=Penicillium cf. griseofulvum TaxID=2972120 RepID=A0A9W9JDC9_9EURO|nr:Major facilitator superfamily domain general substrate transporter [Penicillium cf. griseofulvum]KAJ5445385.1 Major facilitator superfamily domain general substrate transporter [Penicillium cf. griseofulvum]
MGISNFRSAFRRSSTQGSVTQVAVGTNSEKKSELPTEIVAIPNENNPEVPTENAQQGVKDLEAVTLSWTKGMLIAVFINIWFLYFVNAMQSTIGYSLLSYVTSDFESHSLLSVVSIVAEAMTAAVYIPTAKAMDVWGRAEGFLTMAVFATLGLIIMAACDNLPTYCAAWVFYRIGFGGMTYCVDVITADISKLKNRGLAYAFTASPYIITAFAGPKAAEGFYADNWRWAFGTFSIIFPIVASPLYFILKFNLRKAHQNGLAVREQSGRTLLQSIWFYTKEFDLFGVLVFSIGLTIFLLPFSISTYAPNGWASGYIIAMIVLGFVMLAVFLVWEFRFAPAPMFNFSLLTDRTIIGACLLDATYQLSYYCWNNYYTSFLQVVNDLSISEAGYVSNTFDVVSGFLLLGVGFVIRSTGRFKWTLYIAVPLYIFAQGLMIHFRRPNQSVGYLVMCQIFISIGGSIFIIVQQLAVLAAADHQHVATVLALLNVVGTVGNAAGSTISGAIWTNTFYKALETRLPESAMGDIGLIYESLDQQLLYPVGSAARLAIQEAYAYSQTRMLAVGTGIMGLCIFWTLMIRDIDLKKVAQVKGTVF